MGNPANVKIEAMSCTWGAATAQVQTINCGPDVSDSLDGKYFLIYTATNATKYHVWFNTSGGSATDPAPGGSTAQVVALTTGDTATAVATAVASAIDGLAGFVATSSGATVTVTNAATGYSSAVHDSPSASASGFTFAVTTQGMASADVGLIDGEIKFNGTSEDLEAVTAQQSGSTVLTHIRKGLKEQSITVTFKETTVAQLKKLLEQAGSSFIPAGANSTEVTGMGTGTLFSNTIAQANKLVFHPVALPTTDHSRDFTVHKAYAMLEGLTFSGEKIYNFPVKFMMYQDTTKRPGVDFWVFGDGTQTLT